MTELQSWSQRKASKYEKMELYIGYYLLRIYDEETARLRYTHGGRLDFLSVWIF